MQGMATRLPVALHSSGPKALEPWSPGARSSENSTFDQETEMARGQVLGHSAWGDEWKVSNRVQICFARGTRLLKDCFGIEMAAFQETSCTSASNSPWEEGSGGLALGTEKGRREGSGEGVSRQQLASPPHSSFLKGCSYLSVLSGMPASTRAARNCARTPRMLLMNPLESGKRGKPMSG